MDLRKVMQFLARVLDVIAIVQAAQQHEWVTLVVRVLVLLVMTLIALGQGTESGS